MTFSHFSANYGYKRIYVANSMREAMEFQVLFGGNIFKWFNVIYNIL